MGDYDNSCPLKLGALGANVWGNASICSCLLRSSLRLEFYEFKSLYFKQMVGCAKRDVSCWLTKIGKQELVNELLERRFECKFLRFFKSLELTKF